MNMPTRNVAWHEQAYRICLNMHTPAHPHTHTHIRAPTHWQIHIKSCWRDLCNVAQRADKFNCNQYSWNNIVIICTHTLHLCACVLVCVCSWQHKLAASPSPTFLPLGCPLHCALFARQTCPLLQDTRPEGSRSSSTATAPATATATARGAEAVPEARAVPGRVGADVYAGVWTGEVQFAACCQLRGKCN